MTDQDKARTRNFLAEIFKKTVLPLSLVQILSITVNIVDSFLNEDTSKQEKAMQLRLGLLVILAYILLAWLVRNACTRTEMITLLSVIIFVMH